MASTVATLLLPIEVSALDVKRENTRGSSEKNLQKLCAKWDL
jgi:hypothetical protein